MSNVAFPTHPVYNVLYADDDDQYRDILVLDLEDAIPGLSITPVASVQEATKALNDGLRFHIVLTDMKMLSDQEGLQVVEAAAKAQPWAEIIVLTAYGDLNNVREAIEKGAGQYLDKNAHDFNGILAAMIGRRLPRVAAREELSSFLTLTPRELVGSSGEQRDRILRLVREGCFNRGCVCLDLIGIYVNASEYADSVLQQTRQRVEQALGLLDRAVDGGWIIAADALRVKDLLTEILHLIDGDGEA